MGRRVRTGLFLAAAAGILSLLARTPGEPRTAVPDGERAEESLRAAGTKTDRNARPVAATERR